MLSVCVRLYLRVTEKEPKKERKLNKKKHLMLYVAAVAVQVQQHHRTSGQFFYFLEKNNFCLFVSLFRSKTKRYKIQKQHKEAAKSNLSTKNVEHLFVIIQ